MTLPHSLPEPFRALVLGASGTIGSAFVRQLQAHPRCVSVTAISRHTQPRFDLRDEASMVECAQSLSTLEPFHLIVDATGALTIEGQGPEKALSALNATGLMQALHINTVGPALLLRHMAPRLASGPAIYAKLSARVGSIADNRKGGWYSYRASKAAMNMVLQTAAIELQRRQPQWRVVALQPGTVRSALSAPFVANQPHVLDADESVSGMLSALLTLPPTSGAQFIDHAGQSIPW